MVNICKKNKLGGAGERFACNMLCLPGLLSLVLFHFVPVFGIILAFKKYSYSKGILGSDWVGFKNFEFFFKSNDMVRILRNTVLYNVAWMLLVNIFLGIVVAILLYEVKSRWANKLYQTSMLIPNFISWVAVAYIGYILLSPTEGVLNKAIVAMGGTAVKWYSEPSYWPAILTFFAVWKDVGMASLYYYASLLSIDTTLYEAASIDGAGRFKQIMTISIPECLPMMCMVLILRMGQVMNIGMDIFYQVPMQQSALYETTDVISTYLYRGLASGDIGTTAAVGLFQSLIGVVLLFATNMIIKRVNPENAVL